MNFYIHFNKFFLINFNHFLCVFLIFISLFCFVSTNAISATTEEEELKSKQEAALLQILQKVARKSEENPMAAQLLEMYKKEAAAKGTVDKEPDKQTDPVSNSNSKRPLSMDEKLKKMQESMFNQAKAISNQAGAIKEQHETATYDKLSLNDKLVYFLDTDKKRDQKELHRLIKKGADIEYQHSSTFERPLHLAAKHGNLDAVRILVDAGVERTIYNYRGFTAAQLANKNHYEQVALYLDPTHSEKITREIRTDSPLVGSWQKADNPKYQLHFRRDFSTFTKRNSHESEGTWRTTKETRRNIGQGRYVPGGDVIHVIADTVLDKNGVIDQERSRLGSSEWTYYFEGEDLYLQARHIQARYTDYQRYIHIELDDDSMIRK